MQKRCENKNKNRPTNKIRIKAALASGQLMGVKFWDAMVGVPLDNTDWNGRN